MDYEVIRDQVRKKQKTIYLVFGILIAVAFLCVTFPPIVAAWDRNDVWVGAIPLSQFGILFFPFMGVVCMFIMYMLDKRLEETLREAKKAQKAKGGDVK